MKHEREEEGGNVHMLILNVVTEKSWCDLNFLIKPLMLSSNSNFSIRTSSISILMATAICCFLQKLCLDFYIGSYCVSAEITDMWTIFKHDSWCLSEKISGRRESVIAKRYCSEEYWRVFKDTFERWSCFRQFLLTCCNIFWKKEPQLPEKWAIQKCGLMFQWYFVVKVSI